MPEPAVIRFRSCVVRIFPDARYLETLYPDGTRVPAAPQDTPAYRATAGRLGYGDDVWAMCWQHEICHHLLAERAGLPHSPTLWDVAHGLPADDGHYCEEAAVLDLQRDVMAGCASALCVEARELLGLVGSACDTGRP